MANKKMTTSEVLLAISGEGGFNNYKRWNKKEVAQWVMGHYDCSRYVANNVAWYIA